MAVAMVLAMGLALLLLLVRMLLPLPVSQHLAPILADAGDTAPDSHTNQIQNSVRILTEF